MSTDRKDEMPTDEEMAEFRYRPTRVIAGILGLFMGITPIVGNAILKTTTYTSAFATDDTAALQKLALTSASIFAATGITLGPMLWARYVEPSDPDDSIIPGWIRAFLFSPLLYAGWAILASTASWGVLRYSGYVTNIAISKAAASGAVGGLVVGGGLWVLTGPTLGALLIVLARGMMSDNPQVLPRRWTVIVNRLWGIAGILGMLGMLGLYLCALQA